MLKSLGLWKKSEESEGSCEGSESVETVSDDGQDQISVASHSSSEQEIHQSMITSQHSSQLSLQRSSSRTSVLSASSSTPSSSSTTKKRDMSASSRDVASLLSHMSGDTSEATFANDFSSKESSSTLMTTMRQSALSRDSTITQGSLDESETLTKSHRPLEVSEIHYTQPYLESHLDEHLISENEDSRSDIPSFSTYVPSTVSSRKSQIYAVPVKQDAPYSSEGSSSHNKSLSKKLLSQPSLASYQEPYSISGRLSNKHFRQRSIMSTQSHFPRKSSLMVATNHRRQHSAGSRVSFQTCDISASPARRPSKYRRRQSLASHSVYSSGIASSGSFQINCHNLGQQFQKLKDIKKPNFEDIKENVHKLPEMAKNT